MTHSHAWILCRRAWRGFWTVPGTQYMSGQWMRSFQPPMPPLPGPVEAAVLARTITEPQEAIVRPHRAAFRPRRAWKRVWKQLKALVT